MLDWVIITLVKLVTKCVSLLKVKCVAGASVDRMGVLVFIGADVPVDFVFVIEELNSIVR